MEWFGKRKFVVPCGVGVSRYPLDLSTLEKVSTVKPRCENLVPVSAFHSASWCSLNAEVILISMRVSPIEIKECLRIGGLAGARKTLNW